MKKLIALGCCGLALHSFSQQASGADANDEFAGRRVLIKALAVIVNSEANRKLPVKQIHLPRIESPKA